MVDRRVKSEFVCKEFDWLWCKRGKIFGFVFKSLFFVKKSTKTRDLDALEVIIFVKWKNQAILIQNILIQTVDKAPSCEGAFLVSWLQKLCTYKHIRSSENAVFTGLFTTFLV